MTALKKVFAFFLILNIFLFFPIFKALAEEDLIWSLDIGKNSSSRPCIPEIEDGFLYIPKETGLIKVSGNGEKLWEFEIPQKFQRQVTGSPIIAGNFIVLTSGYFGGYAYFINKNTGELVKEHELFSPTSSGKYAYYYSKPSLSLNKENVYINFSYPSYLFGFNTENGEMFGKKFVSDEMAGPSYAPQVTSRGDLMYFGSINGMVFSTYPYGFLDGFGEGNIDLINFVTDPTPSQINSMYLLGPAIDYKKRVLYFFDRKGEKGAGALLALNLGDGRLLWQKEIEPSASSDSVTSPIIDNFGNIFILSFDKIPNGKNRISKISPSGELVSSYEFPVNFNLFSPPIMDKAGDIYVSLDKLYKFKNSLGNPILEFNLDSSYSGSSPILSVGSNYIFVVSGGGILYKIKNSYEDLGCTRQYFCQSSPKHNPVILVHGLGGKDTDWTTGNKAPIRNAILENYKKDNADFPDSWVYPYHYGFDSNGKYNYQGDIREIAKGLQEDVARLSQESLEAGGSGKVDLVGFSLGGQIIREYFAQMVRDPDKEEDNRPHNVDKAVIIASPNNGSAYIDAKVSAEKHAALPMQALESLGNFLFEATSKNGQPLNLSSLALEQLRSDSSFMKRVSYRYSTDVDYNLIYADISTTFKQDFFGVSVGGKASLGDGLVSATSASSLPNIPNVKKYVFDDDEEMIAKLNIFNTYAETRIEYSNFSNLRYLHLALIEQPEIKEKILDILAN